ncbi:MAG: transposase [Cyanobacteria bacterium P01_C01_bin.118]
MKIAGCDCGKDSLYVCVLDQIPKDLKSFSRSYKPNVVKANREGIDWLLEQDADCYVLEPTGSYSYLWIDQLKKHGKDVRLVSPIRVRAYCRYKNIFNKADKPDAAAIASYSLENYSDTHAFLGTEQMELRELYLSLKSTVRNRNPLANRLGQRLTYECPEIAPTVEKCQRPWMDKKPPAILRRIAEEGEDRAPYWKQRQARIENTIGRGLSQHSKELAKELCNFHRMEYSLECQIAELVSNEKFAQYQSIFDQFCLPPKTRAAILGAIYPFESFLNEHAGQIIEYIPGDFSKRKDKLTKRNRSEASFKLALGIGKVQVQSGKKLEWKAGGPKHVRTAIWIYVSVVIVILGKSNKTREKDIEKLVNTLGNSKQSHWLNESLVSAATDYMEVPRHVAALRLHYKFARPNEKDKLRRAATASRFVRSLYKELVKEFAVK